MTDNSELSLTEVETALTERGYTVLTLEKIWRHFTGKVEKDGRLGFFKMSTTPDVVPFTKNEYAWNAMLTDQPLNADIRTPRNYDVGELNGLFWFVSEYVDGSLLASPDEPSRVEDLRRRLPEIVRLVRAIVEYPVSAVLPSDSKLSDEERKTRFWERIAEWEKRSQRDLSVLKSFIRQREGFWLEAPHHGDFVPWHLIMNAMSQMYLVDGEHSRTRGVKFYDLAYCYHRIFTKLMAPELADELLKEFQQIYQFSDQDRECFRMILAQRIIGGYSDAAQDERVSVDHQDELAARLLAGQVL